MKQIYRTQWILFTITMIVLFGVLTFINISSQRIMNEIRASAEDIITDQYFDTQAYVKGFTDGVRDKQAAAEVAQYATSAFAAPTPEVKVSRYGDLKLTDADIETLARLVFLEAGAESEQGQQAVAEVVFNRIMSDDFPDSLNEVVYQKDPVEQFSPSDLISSTEATQEQYDVINAALYGENILPLDVVFFSRKPENDRIWGTIGNHVFCYAYRWSGENADEG